MARVTCQSSCQTSRRSASCAVRKRIPDRRCRTMSCLGRGPITTKWFRVVLLLARSPLDVRVGFVGLCTMLRCASSENHWADWSYHSTILDIEAVMSEYWRAPTGGAVVPGTLSRKHIQAAYRRRHPRQAYHRLRPKKGSQPWRRRWLSFDSELPSWRSTPRARPQAEASRG